MTWSKLSRQLRNYGSAWEATRKRVLERDSGLCQACLRKNRVTIGDECHHVKPRAQGGSDDPANLTTLCGPCHREADAVASGRRFIKRSRVALDGTLIDG